MFYRDQEPAERIPAGLQENQVFVGNWNKSTIFSRYKNYCMKALLISGLTLMNLLPAFGQIQLSDSTVQVIGYWDKNEQQSYSITQEKYKVFQGDTTAREFLKYAVDITVADATADSYTITWFYHDFEVITENPLLKKIAPLAEEMTVTFLTDEYGTVKEVLNWAAIRDYIYKGTRQLKKEMVQIPGMDQLIGQMEEMYSTKASIEAGAIKEIHQYYTFHGARYKLGESIQASVKVPNLYGGDPFDTEVTLWLDEINPDDHNWVMRMQQTIDSKQLTQRTLEYLTKMAEALQIPAPIAEEFPDVTHQTWTASRIHESGWVIYSIETKEVMAEGVLQVEERIIEIR